jgi:hypothetical protein
MVNLANTHSLGVSILKPGPAVHSREQHPQGLANLLLEGNALAFGTQPSPGLGDKDGPGG